jgi:hypothetical protein
METGIAMTIVSLSDKQGSRTGTCGWITSLFFNKYLKDVLSPIWAGRSAELQKSVKDRSLCMTLFDSIDVKASTEKVKKSERPWVQNKLHDGAYGHPTRSIVRNWRETACESLYIHVFKNITLSVRSYSESVASWWQGGGR